MGAGIEIWLSGADPDAIAARCEIMAILSWPERWTSRTTAGMPYRRTGRLCVRAERATRRIKRGALEGHGPNHSAPSGGLGDVHCDKFATIVTANRILTISG
jgi:hypothetical protein